MGTGQSSRNTQDVARIKKPPKCSICRQVITDSCTWRQGRCPHAPSMLGQIMSDPYRSRFYNLIKLFTGKSK